MLQHLFQDLRYATRLLLKTPGFSVIAVLTLALGIGANTAIFTVVRGVLLRPLPYPHSERLVTVWQDVRARGGPADEWATPGNYADWQREKALFEEVAVITNWRPTLTGGAEAEPITGEQVSHQYFSVLGIAPALGGAFSPEEDVPNAPRVAIISDALWKRRFGGSPSVVGQIGDARCRAAPDCWRSSSRLPAYRLERGRDLASASAQPDEPVAGIGRAAHDRSPASGPVGRSRAGGCRDTRATARDGAS